MSLKIEKVPADTGITVALAGRLDTSTAPELEAELEKLLPAAATLTFDLADAERDEPQGWHEADPCAGDCDGGL